MHRDAAILKNVAQLSQQLIESSSFVRRKALSVHGLGRRVQGLSFVGDHRGGFENPASCVRIEWVGTASISCDESWEIVVCVQFSAQIAEYLKGWDVLPSAILCRGRIGFDRAVER